MTQRKPPPDTGEDYDARLEQARAEGDQLKQSILDEVLDPVARPGSAEENTSRAEVLHSPRGVHTPCQLCGMCEYGYGCEGDTLRKPLCFYRLKELEDALLDLNLPDGQIDAITDVVQTWLKGSLS